MYQNYALLPPVYECAGKTHELSRISDHAYADGKLRVQQTLTQDRPDTLRVRREWENVSGECVHIRCALKVKARFVAERYLIPCVNYNGNRWGKGCEPKGIERDGQPWVFSAQRTGIPACTISECADQALAVFAVDTPKSLDSACSLEADSDGVLTHVIWYPAIERPLTYCRRDEYGPAWEPELTLEPGEKLILEAYIWTGVPYWPNYAAANVQDVALELFKPEPPQIADEVELRTAGIAYARTLMTDFDSGRLLIIGLSPKGDGFARNDHFEIGWCGQNALYARMMLREYQRTGEKALYDSAISVLDTWLKARQPNGLMYVHYEKRFTDDSAVDTCNLGYAAAEYARCHKLMRGLGQDKPEWLALARGICDFFIEHFSNEVGFGKSWDARTGELLDGGGTIGAYIIMGLMEVWSETGDTRYLECAQRAFDFYVRRDLDEFTCTAGALDTVCVDKETSGALVIGGIQLYEATGDARYLEDARRAAYYFCSWMFYYDANYAPDSDFARYGWRTTGGTSVSAQHHHIDGWGAAMSGWLLRLARYTGDERWRLRARLLFANAAQCVALHEGELVRGRKRPRGSQNEAYIHCRWGLSATEPQPGSFNDWLVAWPGAFRLWAIDMAEEFGGWN